MNSAADFAKMLPGMDFLQGLVRNAGAALPGLGQWVTPTLDPEELDKRIQDLRTVQFWLEQNARLLATTVQALEVQRMTLATLKTMNLPMAELAQALQARPAPAGDTSVPPPVVAPPAPVAPPAAPPAEPPASAAGPDDAAPAAPPAVDPMQWWGALTQQFGEIAARALKEGAAALPGAAVPQDADLPGARRRAPGAAAPAVSTRQTTKAPKKAPKKVSTQAVKKAPAKAATTTAAKAAAKPASRRRAARARPPARPVDAMARRGTRRERRRERRRDTRGG